MREFARVLPSFWTGETGRRIRALGEKGITARLVAAYLITSPHAEALGVYRLPLPYIAHDIGCSIEGASEALRCLSEVGFAQYDAPSEVVWVPEMARIQVGDLKETDKRRTWVASKAREIERMPFFSEFIEKYGRAYGLATQGPPKALQKKPKGPPKPRAGEGAGEGEGSSKRSADGGPSACKRGHWPLREECPGCMAAREVFAHWVAVMEKRNGATKLDKARAYRIRDRLADGFSVEVLKRAIDGCRASKWHMGLNDRHKTFNDLTLILRDAKHVEQFSGEQLVKRSTDGASQIEMDAWMREAEESERDAANLLSVPS